MRFNASTGTPGGFTDDAPNRSDLLVVSEEEVEEGEEEKEKKKEKDERRRSHSVVNLFSWWIGQVVESLQLYVKSGH